MALNKVMLIGNVGKKPEVRYLEKSTPGSAKVATFSLATTERYKAKDGTVKEATEWHNIVAWRGLADLCEKYVEKGSPLFIEGRIRSRSWDGQDGQKHYITEIEARNIELLGRRQGSQQQVPPPTPDEDTAPKELPPLEEAPSDDLPF